MSLGANGTSDEGEFDPIDGVGFRVSGSVGLSVNGDGYDRSRGALPPLDLWSLDEEEEL